MAQYFRIHSDNPQKRLTSQSARIMNDGGVVIYPTDSCYALGCRIGDKDALERIKRIRHLEGQHNMTILCKDLSDIGNYARVHNAAYRLMKSLTPGPYTFLLKATRDVPRRLQHPRRKTIGVRVPDNVITLALLREIGEPILSTSLILPDTKLPLTDPAEINAALGGVVDLIIDGGYGGLELTTVVDLVDDKPVIIRAGKGDLAAIGT